jgi:hypothetical protein
MKRWSLKRVGFVLGHLESFVEADDDRDLRQRVRDFSPQTDLTGVTTLTLTDPQDPRLPELVLERLAPFFDSGALIQRPVDAGDWAVTDVFGRGTTFHLEHDEQIAAGGLVPESTPLHVRRAPADPLLDALNLKFLLPSREAHAYLFRPTPAVCLVLISNLAPVFARDHVARARDLINACFLY